MLGRLGQWSDARRALEHAHERDPEDANVESNLGWIYANLGLLDQARQLLEDAIVRQPREPSAHGNLGWVRLRSGDPGAALTALAVGQSLDPGNAWIANMQGIAHAASANGRRRSWRSSVPLRSVRTPRWRGTTWREPSTGSRPSFRGSLRRPSRRTPDKRHAMRLVLTRSQPRPYKPWG